MPQEDILWWHILRDIDTATNNLKSLVIHYINQATLVITDADADGCQFIIDTLNFVVPL